MASRSMQVLGRSLAAFMAWSAVCVLLLALYAFAVEPNRIVVERATFEMASRIDPQREGRLRVAFVSDFDMTGSPGLFERRVRGAVNALDADLVAIGGDLFGGDGWRPDDRVISELRRWLAGFEARDGTVVVWGEQDLEWKESLAAALPDGVRDLHSAAELHAAGDAMLRVTGPDGLFAPLWIDERGGGSLRTDIGPSLTVARYHGGDDRAWSSFELTATLALGAYSDPLGLSLLEAEGRPGYRLEVSGARSQWTLSDPGRLRAEGRRVARSVVVAPGTDYVVRARVVATGEANFILSRIWPAGEREPAAWQIEVVDRSPERPASGTVAVLTGGSWHGSGRQRWRSIEVRDLRGGILMREDFDDAARFAREWDNPGPEPGAYDATVMVGHQSEGLLEMPVLARPPADLVLAGHTHGGQVRLPLFGPLHLEPRLPRDWSMGWVRLPSRHTWMYTTRGVGVSRAPIRFLCPPEVTLMEIVLRHRPPL
jgi:predicted MPP superfamily phosphohydrolase